jgi:hypothetical protein
MQLSSDQVVKKFITERQDGYKAIPAPMVYNFKSLAESNFLPVPLGTYKIPRHDYSSAVNEALRSGPPPRSGPDPLWSQLYTPQANYTNPDIPATGHDGHSRPSIKLPGLPNYEQSDFLSVLHRVETLNQFYSREKNKWVDGYKNRTTGANNPWVTDLDDKYTQQLVQGYLRNNKLPTNIPSKLEETLLEVSSPAKKATDVKQPPVTGAVQPRGLRTAQTPLLNPRRNLAPFLYSSGAPSQFRTAASAFAETSAPSRFRTAASTSPVDAKYEKHGLESGSSIVELDDDGNVILSSSAPSNVDWSYEEEKAADEFRSDLNSQQVTMSSMSQAIVDLQDSKNQVLEVLSDLFNEKYELQELSDMLVGQLSTSTTMSDERKEEVKLRLASLATERQRVDTAIEQQENLVRSISARVKSADIDLKAAEEQVSQMQDREFVFDQNLLVPQQDEIVNASKVSLLNKSQDPTRSSLQNSTLPNTSRRAIQAGNSKVTPYRDLSRSIDEVAAFSSKKRNTQASNRKIFVQPAFEEMVFSPVPTLGVSPLAKPYVRDPFLFRSATSGRLRGATLQERLGNKPVLLRPQRVRAKKTSVPVKDTENFPLVPVTKTPITRRALLSPVQSAYIAPFDLLKSPR